MRSFPFSLSFDLLEAVRRREDLLWPKQRWSVCFYLIYRQYLINNASMAPTKSKQWILDAIDHLRLRKARPDIHRICLMLKRKHGLSFPDTVACLEDLVHTGTVLKVDFKGNTSYRNASKWKQNTLGGHVLNSTSVSEKLKEAIAAVSKRIDNQDGADETDIKNWLCAADTTKNWTIISVSEALQREIAPGNIRRLSDGRYCLLSSSREVKKKLKMKAKKTSTSGNNKNAHQTESNAEVLGNTRKRGRPPSKRKVVVLLVLSQT